MHFGFMTTFIQNSFHHHGFKFKNALICNLLKRVIVNLFLLYDIFLIKLEFSLNCQIIIIKHYN